MRELTLADVPSLDDQSLELIVWHEARNKRLPRDLERRLDQQMRAAYAVLRQFHLQQLAKQNAPRHNDREERYFPTRLLLDEAAIEILPDL
jgi:hypothetical protein